MATFATSDQLLVIIDPIARRTDGESVRIAKDVLSAGATTKLCLPDDSAEFARALVRRGSRRPVVIGDDRALTRAVSLLHRRRELAGCALSLVPVGGTLELARSLGVPTDAVRAARAVLDGIERRRDLLADDSDGVVLGGLGILAGPTVRGGADARGGPDAGGGPAGDAGPATSVSGWPRLRSRCRSLARTLGTLPSRTAPAQPAAGPMRLRVEVDGITVVDLDRPVEGVSVSPGGSGLAEVEVALRRAPGQSEPERLRALGRTVSVSGADFRYRADADTWGPVRRRTWRVMTDAWSLTVPREP